MYSKSCLKNESIREFDTALLYVAVIVRIKLIPEKVKHKTKKMNISAKQPLYIV